MVNYGIIQYYAAMAQNIVSDSNDIGGNSCDNKVI